MGLFPFTPHASLPVIFSGITSFIFSGIYIKKIEKLMSLNFGLDFSKDLDIYSTSGANMDLSRLKAIKCVTPASDYAHYWALSPKAISEYPAQYISRPGLNIVPLGFKRQNGLENLRSGDLIALTQRAKITHIAEFLDDHAYEEGGWFHRHIKIVWWQPNIDWSELPHRQDVMEFDVAIYDGNPHEFERFNAFHERWDDKGGLDAFQLHLARQLTLITELVLA